MNMKNRILAIPADAPAIPPKPKTPAINAIITNVIVQRNMFFDFLVNKCLPVLLFKDWCAS
ncbi:hypothetical protein APS56_08360 [Pseudalgibacter alginicilyticus]|uniref:Uncharacterized protein n=1 Tax=Pseudalgibacter alginicilyticus TaxID=1736674 RepID=A0A0P0DF89_9FLAO|nr:hypothetical protein APS56_08360 [Pseudalgibacter alginicilyticus]